MVASNQPGKIACPHCAAMIKAPALAAGSLVNCPKCGQGFRLGESAVGGQQPGARSQGQGARGQESKVESRAVPPSRAAVVPPPPEAGAKPKRRTLNDEARELAARAATAGIGGQAASGTQAHGGSQAAANPKSKIQNPKSAPDNLVDPNLLAPPPPRVQPKPKDVTIICRLCGTRLYAPLEKIGQTIKCADCHTVNEIVGPKEAVQKKPEGPTLEGAEDYGLSDPGQRPAYRPLQAARGEYQVLGALDPAHVDHGWAMPAARPGDAPAAPTGDEEIRLEAPAERVSLAPPPTTVTLPDAPPDPEEALYDGRYDDRLIGDFVDGRETDAWKKSPFVYGLVEFLVYPSTLLRLVPYAVGLALLVNLGQLTVESASGLNLLAPFIIPLFIACSAAWLAPFFAACLAIVQGTANGEKEVGNWPDWNMSEWIGNALYVPIAAFLTGLPGILITAALLAGGADPKTDAFFLAAPILVCWLLLFPPAIYSMLAEVSMLALVSPHTWRSLEIAKDGWMLFYLYSFVILLCAALAGALAAVGSFIVAALGAVGLVVLAFLYARLLGRLMWYAAQEEARQEAVASRRAQIAKRYSTLGQTPLPNPPRDQSLHHSRA